MTPLSPEQRQARLDAAVAAMDAEVLRAQRAGELVDGRVAVRLAMDAADEAVPVAAAPSTGYGRHG